MANQNASTNDPARHDQQGSAGSPQSPPPQITRDLLLALPKTDLHLHLDGSLRLETLIELAKERNVELPSQTTDGLLELVFKEKYNDLPEYLHGFALTCAVMTDAEALERIAYELAEDNLAEGVYYIEVRFAPQLHTRKDFDIADVLSAVTAGLERARKEHGATEAVKSGQVPPFRYGIIACAMRMFTGGFSPYFAKLWDALDSWPANQVHSAASMSLARSVVDARDRLGLPVVGFDLAGAEHGHPASDHARAFRFAHRHFLKKTVHAGEAYGPESIFQAITKLYADRIGHGTQIYSVDRLDTSAPERADPQRYIDQLVEFVSDRRITLEVCITSNLQTMPEMKSVADHPFGRMVRDRLSVSICTDNRLVSRTTVTDELLLAVNGFDLQPNELRNVIVYGFKRSFFPGTYAEKRRYVRAVLDHYDRIADDHGLSRPVSSRIR